MDKSWLFIKIHLLIFFQSHQIQPYWLNFEVQAKVWFDQNFSMFGIQQKSLENQLY